MHQRRFVTLALPFLLPTFANGQDSFFPYKMPKQKPSIPLSAAMERTYDAYESPTYWWNELLTLGEGRLIKTLNIGFNKTTSRGTSG